MGNELDGRVVIVTGAARGIGSASAERIAAAGATVVITDILDEEGERVAAKLRSSGYPASFIRADMTLESDISDLVDRVVETHGHLDGAFNNAGVLQRGKMLHELSIDEWEHAIRVDLTGVFLCMKYEILAMASGDGGSIVNTASALGQVAISGASEYVAAKHGVLGVTRAAASEYAAHGVRVNAIMPGIINSFDESTLDDYALKLLDSVKARHPIGRFGQPAEVGDAAAWLLSEASSFVNGASIAVDGGYLAV